MDSKFVLLITLIFFVGLSIFVVAASSSLDFGGSTVNGKIIEAKIDFQKGWNLIYGLGNPLWLSGGTIEPSNIKAIYALDYTTQTYVRVYPNPEKKLKDLREDYLLSVTAFWVYSDKAGSSSYYSFEPFPLNERRLTKGWNMIGLTDNMRMGYSEVFFKDIKGDCEVERAYLYLGEENRPWMDFTQVGEIDSRVIGKGIIIKVANDCKLGSQKAEIPTVPPALPN